MDGVCLIEGAGKWNLLGDDSIMSVQEVMARVRVGQVRRKMLDVKGSVDAGRV